MNPILKRAEKRRRRALEIIEELDLINRWSQFGKPVIVGSISHGLVVAPDIDMEIYSDNPQISQGFQIMAEVAESSNVIGIMFENKLKTRGKWLYWEVRYRDKDGEYWNIETYFCSPGDPYAHWPEQLSEAMQRILAEESRIAILSIKEALCKRSIMKDFMSFDIYRAVLDYGIRSVEEFLKWIKINKSKGIVKWIPKANTERIINSEQIK